MGLIEIVLAGLCLNATCPENGPRNHSMHGFIVKSDLFQQLEQDLKKETLTVATLDNENLSGSLEVNGSLVGTGVAFTILNILQDKYGFNYTVVKPQDKAWGADSRGLLYSLTTGEANMSVAFTPRLWEYTGEISYSPSLDTGDWVVLMRRPKASASGSGVMAPFTVNVWISILITLILIGPIVFVIVYLQAKLCKDDNNKIFPLDQCIWFVYGGILKQGTTLNPTTHSSRLVFSSWWIFITIVTAFYTANLTAFLTLSKFTLPINKPQDLGNKKSKWVTNKGNALEDTTSYINYTYEWDKRDSPAIKPIAQVLGKARFFVDSPDSQILTEYVQKRNLLFLREKPIVEYIMFEDYKQKTKQGISENKRCTFVITTFPVVSYDRAFAYSKNFKYKPLFDSALLHLVEAGVVKYNLRSQLPHTAICPLDLGSKERQLRNADLVMTYEIIGTGFGIATAVFLIENIWRRLIFKKEGRHWALRNTKLALKQAPSFDSAATDYSKFGGIFPSPPPSYFTLFNHPADQDKEMKKRNINGRDYWVYDGKDQRPRMIPMRTPSALLFQFTN